MHSADGDSHKRRGSCRCGGQEQEQPGEGRGVLRAGTSRKAPATSLAGPGLGMGGVPRAEEVRARYGRGTRRPWEGYRGLVAARVQRPNRWQPSPSVWLARVAWHQVPRQGNPGIGLFSHCLPSRVRCLPMAPGSFPSAGIKAWQRTAGRWLSPAASKGLARVAVGAGCGCQGRRLRHP